MEKEDFLDQIGPEDPNRQDEVSDVLKERLAIIYQLQNWLHKSSLSASNYRILSVSIVFFLLSMPFSALEFRLNDSMSSWNVLAFGWAGILFGQFYWLANPCLALSWFFTLFNQFDKALFFSILSLIFALSCLSIDSISRPSQRGGLVSQSTLEGYGLGFWIWLLGILVTLILLVQKHKRPVS